MHVAEIHDRKSVSIVHAASQLSLVVAARAPQSAVSLQRYSEVVASGYGLHARRPDHLETALIDIRAIAELTFRVSSRAPHTAVLFQGNAVLATCRYCNHVARQSRLRNFVP